MTTQNNPAIFKANQVQALRTSDEAAAYLNISSNTLAVWRCNRSQAIPFVKLGRSVRYRQSDLDAYLEAKTFGIEA